MPVAQIQFFGPKLPFLAVLSQNCYALKDLFYLAAVCACVHNHRPANGSRNPGSKFHAGKTLFCGIPGRRGQKRPCLELKNRRVEKQPLEYPSAGSTFKRPEGYFAGKLIQDTGLRGYQVGGAQVSEKHCGFVINKEKAVSKDIRQLITDVQDQVEAQFGVRLEPEVKFIGDF